MKRLCLYLAAGAALLGNGCDNRPESKQITVVAVDRSGSTSRMRDSLMGALDQSYQLAAIWRSNLAIWAVDFEPMLLWGPRVPSDEFLPESVKRELDPSRQASRRGTRPALLWEELANAYAASTVRTQIDYLTDGGNDAPADLPRLRDAVKRLGENLNVQVAILGVLPSQKLWLEREFRPSFGDRLVIAGLAEIPDEMKRRLKQ